MKSTKKKTFFRVQSGIHDSQGATFQIRSTPSGGKVVSIRRESYESAKKAAARALHDSKQPA